MSEFNVDEYLNELDEKVKGRPSYVNEDGTYTDFGIRNLRLWAEEIAINMDEQESPEDRFREFVKGKSIGRWERDIIESSSVIPKHQIGIYYHYKDINFDGTWKDHVGKN